MEYYFTDIDLTTLPQELLPLTKAHLRIDFSDDDTLILQYIGNAIQICEDVWSQRINPANVTWKPTINDTDFKYQVPVQPISSFQVSSGGAPVAGYSMLVTSRTSPIYIAKDDGTAWPGDAEVALVTGFASATDISPAYAGPILRVAGTLYERRETITTPMMLVPYWLNDLIVGNWIPRV